MKRFLSYAMCAAAVCLAACSQDETFEQVNADSHMISFRASLPQDAMMTKADANVGRYIMQVVKPDGGWLDFDPSEETALERQVNATGEFQIDGDALSMEIGGTYTALFWADYDTPTTASADAVYSADWLNWVSWNKSKPMTMAYCGKLDFVYGNDATTDIVLKRAVAQVNLKQTTEQTPAAGDQISAAYSAYTVYDVRGTFPAVGGDGNAVNPETVTATVNVPAELAADATIGSILVFATSAADQSTMTNFTFTYTGKEAFPVNNVPLRANYQTNINGDFVNGPTTTDYEFTVTTGDAWDGTIEGNEGQGGTDEGEEGGQGGEEQPTEDTVAPTFGTVTVTADGLTINYSITANDETSLAGGWMEIKLTKDWEQVGTEEAGDRQYRWVDFGADAGTTQTVTGTFTAPEAGTYRVEYKVRDSLKDDSSHEAYNSYEITVTVE